MESQALESLLRKTLDDLRLSKKESYEIREVVQNISDDKRRFMKNRAFDVANELVSEDQAQAGTALVWLERTIKALDSASLSQDRVNTAHFSPGNDCRTRLLDLMNNAREQLDICVFTISDNRLSDAIIAASKRGVNVRIITDNDKTMDRGNDTAYLMEQGIAVKMDDTSNHMHHKFMVVDNKLLANGSFNWTRSATKYNQENILVTNESSLVMSYSQAFETLWQDFDR